MTRESIAGPTIGAVGLAGFAAAVVAVEAGALDQLVAAAAPTAGGVLLIAFVALGARVAPRGGHSGTSGCAGHHGRVYRGQSGRRALTAHERDGHGRAFRKAGAGGFTWDVWRESDGSWSGVTRMRSPHRWRRLPPEKQIAVLRAGIAAAPRTTSPTDGPEAAAILRRVPAHDRDRVDREADRLVKEWIR